jgi:hypothetical protein
MYEHTYQHIYAIGLVVTLRSSQLRITLLSFSMCVIYVHTYLNYTYIGGEASALMTLLSFSICLCMYVYMYVFTYQNYWFGGEASALVTTDDSAELQYMFMYVCMYVCFHVPELSVWWRSFCPYGCG